MAVCEYAHASHLSCKVLLPCVFPFSNIFMGSIRVSLINSEYR